jgi:hypothetical protein
MAARGSRRVAGPYTCSTATRKGAKKFDKLAADRADEGLRREIKDAVRSLEKIQVSDLMKLLGRIKAAQPRDQLTA